MSDFKKIIQSEHESGLLQATESNNVSEVVRMLSKDVDCDATDRWGLTPLMIACTQGYADIASLLIDAGANLNRQSPLLQTATISAVQNNHQECLLLLIEAGADINVEDMYGWTALIYACRKGLYEISTLLLDANANVNTQENNGWTALMWAAGSGNLETVAILLATGVNIDLQNKKGQTAVDIALNQGHAAIASAIQAEVERRALTNTATPTSHQPKKVKL